MATSTPRTFSSATQDQQTKEALAEETHSTLDDVERVYDEEFSSLAADAKITQFLGVLTSRRVRMKLRKH